MNKRIYSLVWNRSINQVVAASELAVSRGGGASVRGAATLLRRAALVLSLSAALTTPSLAAEHQDRSVRQENVTQTWSPQRVITRMKRRCGRTKRTH